MNAKAATTKKKPAVKKKPRIPKEVKPVEQSLEEQVEQEMAGNAETVAGPGPYVTPEPPPSRAPAPSAPERNAQEAISDAHKRAMQMLTEDANLRKQIAEARAKGQKRKAAELRQAMSTRSRYVGSVIDDTAVPVPLPPGFAYKKWVGLLDSWGRPDPSRSKVARHQAYGGVVLKRDGKEVTSKYGLAMAMPADGAAAKIADSSPRGLVEMQRIEGEVEEEIEQYNRRSGGIMGRMTGVGADFDRALYAKEGRDPDNE